MTRKFVPAALAIVLCLAVSLAHGEPRGKENEKSRGGKSQGKSQAEHKPQEHSAQKPVGGPNAAHGTKPGGNNAPGGDWSERTHGGKQSKGKHGNQHQQSGAAGKSKTSQASGAQGAAAGAAAAKHNSPQASGAQGAAAGAAAANRNNPQASGAQGAAAGAAAAKHNSPQASGAQGAAAGAAAVKRNDPQYSGAQGAAAGAAASRNNPQLSGAQGAAVGAAAANRNTPAVSGAGGAAAGYAAVRNSFNHPNIYGQQWYGAHPGVWAPSGWAAGAAWVPATWGAIAGHCGYGNATPISYDYGVNVIAQDGNVLVDGQSVGTTAEYSQQAFDLAESGTEAETTDTDEWLPIGVFAMVRNEQQHPQLILQMAINKQGILRGNYTDEVTDHTIPIHGAVDKETQRAAWTVGENKSTVMEAGLNDMAEGEAPALIHKNGKTDHWILVRLDQPKQAATDSN